jgi:hypothetical protein
MRLQDYEQRKADNARALLRDRLGEERFERQLADGRAIERQELVEIALRDQRVAHARDACERHLRRRSDPALAPR